jgi:uncharacterized protein VirK/YbjX
VLIPQNHLIKRLSHRRQFLSLSIIRPEPIREPFLQISDNLMLDDLTVFELGLSSEVHRRFLTVSNTCIERVIEA